VEKLDDFNKKRMEEYNKGRLETGVPKLNGIECPNCGKELFDIPSSTILLSNPPQKRVFCNTCGFQDFRVA
jgi:ribosomal protein S27AE